MLSFEFSCNFSLGKNPVKDSHSSTYRLALLGGGKDISGQDHYISCTLKEEQPLRLLLNLFFYYHFNCSELT